ncbi:unnamed protein product [Prorocentrum cordatum]|uniref:Pentatricopeptide repeat-containing protein n=1 Tax=Prorocentrum cordatum TaxID=2364126 RepID=A0ABN9VPD0_9DINO|nr:unnamed protein product [Polarella glacialis]
MRELSGRFPSYVAGHVRMRFSYNAGISACEKGRQWQRALSLLSDMWEAKLVPNAISRSAGILSCDRGGEEQRAIWLLTETWDAKLESSVASFSDALVIAMRR